MTGKYKGKHIISNGTNIKLGVIQLISIKPFKYFMTFIQYLYISLIKFLFTITNNTSTTSYPPFHLPKGRLQNNKT